MPDEVEARTVDPETGEFHPTQGRLEATPFSMLADLDEDGHSDPEDNCPMVPNSAQGDVDGDGVGDSCDVCVTIADPDQTDTDGSGIGDACNRGEGTAPDPSADLDPDDDEYEIGFDNCPNTYNPNQEDVEADGIGDACDPDSDNDGIDDVIDVCPDDFDPGQGDLDGDGVGDACDNCIHALNADQNDSAMLADGIGTACQCGDADGDGVVEEGSLGSDEDLLLFDACLAGTADPEFDSGHPLMDTDGDGVLEPEDRDLLEGSLAGGAYLAFTCGNRPTADFDGDGHLDATIGGEPDPCRTIPDPGRPDLDDDGTPDACDWDADADVVADAVDNCPLLPNPGQQDRNSDGVGDACTPYCDANASGVLDAGDSIICTHVVTGEIPGTPDLVMRCDVAPADGAPTDGLVDVGDIVVIQRALVGAVSGICNALP